MTDKEIVEELQKGSDRHRSIHDWRHKLESRVLFTSLSFYVAATFTILKLDITLTDFIKVVLSFAFVLLAVVTSILLNRLHKANSINKAISENYEAEVLKLLNPNKNPIPSNYIKVNYDVKPLRFFESNWGWQTGVLIVFAISSISLLWVS